MGTPAERQHGAPSGQAKISLSLDGPLGEVHLGCTATWYDGEGNISEAMLQVSGELDELFSLLQECTSWVHRRWRKPVALALDPGPFDT